MTVELRPLGVKCNIQCLYCYQNPQRDAGNVLRQYDMEKMKGSIKAGGKAFSLFGGEALMIPLDDMENLFAFGLAEFKENSVQTNGSLITEEHIRLFKKYKVRVGMSVDGPDELNDVRWAGSLERTREATTKSMEAIERLCQEGIPPSLIITLHKGNATPDKLPRMHAWIKHLDAIGVKSARLHILESESEAVRAKWSLSMQENVDAFMTFMALEKELKVIKFDVFKDMRHMLAGTDKNTTCIWNACDPFTTRAVQGMEGNGQKSNCGRTNKDGIDFVKADQEGFERYIALYHTPQEHGGCKDCRFFLMCKGQCPGTSIDGDWRNRTEHCQVWMDLYERLEKDMLAAGQSPLSARDNDRRAVEKIFIDTWKTGRNMSIQRAVEWIAENKKKAAAKQANGAKQPAQPQPVAAEPADPEPVADSQSPLQPTEA